jgi:hypothetical protein
VGIGPMAAHMISVCCATELPPAPVEVSHTPLANLPSLPPTLALSTHYVYTDSTRLIISVFFFNLTIN